MKTKIKDRHLKLYGYIDRDTEEYVDTCVLIPDLDYEGQEAEATYWGDVRKAGPDERNDKIQVDYQIRLEGFFYPSQFHDILPVVQRRTKVPRPNRSKNWVMDQYLDRWVNKKTGKKVDIFDA